MRPPIRRDIKSLVITYTDGEVEILDFEGENARYKVQSNVVMNTHRQPVARYMNHEILWTEDIPEEE